MRFGARLKTERIELGLTQKQVADTMNVSRQTISSWETENSYPDIDSLIQLSDLFHISLDVLLKEDVGMKEYLKKKEALEWIRPIKQVTITIDILFIISMIFIRNGGAAGVFLLLVALLNMLVMVRVKRFEDELNARPAILRWPNLRKVVYSSAIFLTIVVVFGWVFHLHLGDNASAVAIGLWLGIIIVELTYRFHRRSHAS